MRKFKKWLAGAVTLCMVIGSSSAGFAFSNSDKEQMEDKTDSKPVMLEVAEVTRNSIVLNCSCNDELCSKGMWIAYRTVGEEKWKDKVVVSASPLAETSQLSAASMRFIHSKIISESEPSPSTEPSIQPSPEKVTKEVKIEGLKSGTKYEMYVYFGADQSVKSDTITVKTKSSSSSSSSSGSSSGSSSSTPSTTPSVAPDADKDKETPTSATTTTDPVSGTKKIEVAVEKDQVIVIGKDGKTEVKGKDTVETNTNTNSSKFEKLASIVVDISKLEVKDYTKLTLVKYEVQPDGSIKMIKLGGNYDPNTKTFVSFVEGEGNYAVIEAESLTQIALSANSNETTVNGKKNSLDTPQVIKDGTTYVPLRFIAEALGADVKWNNKTKEATITMEGNSVTINAAKEGMIQNSRTLLPLRKTSESLDAYVLWLPDTKEIKIVK